MINIQLITNLFKHLNNIFIHIYNYNLLTLYRYAQYQRFPHYQLQTQTPYQDHYPSKYTNNPKKKPYSKPRNFKKNKNNTNILY